VVLEWCRWPIWSDSDDPDLARPGARAEPAGYPLRMIASKPAVRPRIVVETHCAEETRDLAAQLAVVAQPGDRLALIGDLGAGKTQFAKGFAVGLGVTEVVNSPSFTLMAEYEGRLPLFHQDLFRLSGADEIMAGGLFDSRTDTGVTISEWADRLDAEVDRERLELRFSMPADGDRRIELSQALGDRYDRYLETAAEWAAGRS
jgi:tRNA threonylcarbamoyladenosine biosynthesis protein TsaE